MHSKTRWPFACESIAVPSDFHPETRMNITLSVGPLVSLIAGILILIVPRMLNYIVAIYLIIIGLLGLFGANIPHLR
jgi:Protein of unknown function (DUF3096)